MDKEQIYSLTNYVLKLKNQSNKNTFSIFNEWSEETGIYISKLEESLWVIEYIKSLQYVDAETIKEALLIDKKEIEKEKKSNGKKQFLWWK